MSGLLVQKLIANQQDSACSRKRPLHVIPKLVTKYRVLASLSLREIFLVAIEKCCHVGVHHIELPVDLLLFTRFEPSNAKVIVYARNHALKDLLVWLPGSGQNLFFVCRITPA